MMVTTRWSAALLMLVLGPVLPGGDRSVGKGSNPSRISDRPEVVFEVLDPGDDGLGSTRATPKYRAAYRMAVAEAEASLKDGRARLYSWGMLGMSRLDPETGLGVMPLAGCVLTEEVLGRTEGNNKIVRAWIKENGPPANSLLRWKDELSDLPAFFAARQKAGAAIPLRIGGPDLTSPDGLVTLRQVTAEVRRGILPDVRTVTTVGLVVGERGVNREVITDDWGEGLIALAWGPRGAPFAVIKHRDRDGIDYIVLHLRPVDSLSGGFPRAEE